MPFAGYANFADCVAQHGDKDNPEAYCAVIMRAVEKIDGPLPLLKYRDDQERDDRGRWTDEGGGGTTASPEFKAWFGESRVVHADGSPLVLYHGRRGDWGPTLRPTTGQQAWLGHGIYLTEHPKTASTYAEQGDAPNVVPVYVRMENPFELDLDSDRMPYPFNTLVDEDLIQLDTVTPAKIARATQWLKDQGYDGVIAYHGLNPHENRQAIYEAVAFEPSQVKSAIGNRGTWSRADDNITKYREDQARDDRGRWVDEGGGGGEAKGRYGMGANGTQPNGLQQFLAKPTRLKLDPPVRYDAQWAPSGWKDGQWVGPIPKGGFKATVGPLPFAFEDQADQYPAKGPPGVGYFKGDTGEGKYVDCLLYRTEEGRVVGILNHYPFDFPPYERAGNINVMVHPKFQHQGIGTKLLQEAAHRWPQIRLDEQKFSVSGVALARSVSRLRGKGGKTKTKKGLVATLDTLLAKYRADQERDDRGRWVDEGGGGLQTYAVRSAVTQLDAKLETKLRRATTHDFAVGWLSPSGTLFDTKQLHRHWSAAQEAGVAATALVEEGYFRVYARDPQNRTASPQYLSFNGRGDPNPAQREVLLELWRMTGRPVVLTERLVSGHRDTISIPAQATVGEVMRAFGKSAVRKYREDQPRDERGRWVEDGRARDTSDTPEPLSGLPSAYAKGSAMAKLHELLAGVGGQDADRIRLKLEALTYAMRVERGRALPLSGPSWSEMADNVVMDRRIRVTDIVDTLSSDGLPAGKGTALVRTALVEEAERLAKAEQYWLAQYKAAYLAADPTYADTFRPYARGALPLPERFESVEQAAAFLQINWGIRYSLKAAPERSYRDPTLGFWRTEVDERRIFATAREVDALARDHHAAFADPEFRPVSGVTWGSSGVERWSGLFQRANNSGLITLNPEYTEEDLQRFVLVGKVEGAGDQGPSDPVAYRTERLLGTRAVLAHEWGHAMNWHQTQRATADGQGPDPDEAWLAGSSKTGATFAYKAAIEPTLGSYATTNAHEFVAEYYAYRRRGGAAHALLDQIYAKQYGPSIPARVIKRQQEGAA